MSPASAQNLLLNSQFDSDLSDWSILFERPAVWDSMDAGGSASSGSVMITNNINGNGATPLTLAQCVSVLPGQSYPFGADVFFPTGQAASPGEPQVFVTSYAAADCTGPTTSSFADNTSNSAADSWQRINGQLTTEAGVNSVRVSLGIQKPIGVNDTITAFFDNVFFGGQGGSGFVLEPQLFEGIWTNPSEVGGQGLMFDYGASFNLIFMAWFTDVVQTNPPTGRILLTALLSIDGNRLSGPLRFNQPDGTGVDIGMITIDITACDAASVELSLTSSPSTTVTFGILPLEKFVNSMGFVCPGTP
ncbi:MAG: hypothetical protein Tsb002_35850 [Wenzhouxiangellaceae bacterium]